MPRSPDEDPAFQAVVRRTRAVAERHGHNNPAQRKAAEAQNAAPGPASELEAQAKTSQVAKLDATEAAEFDKAAFKAALMAKVAELTPKTLEQARDFKKNNGAGAMKGAVQGQVSTSKQAAAEPIATTNAEAPDPSAATPKPVEPLPPTDPGPPPPDLGAARAAPKPRAAQEGQSLVDDAASLDEQLAETKLTDDDLQRSNETDFQAAVKSKNEAKDDAKAQAEGMQADETRTVAASKDQARGVAASQTEGMHQDPEADLELDD